MMRTTVRISLVLCLLSVGTLSVAQEDIPVLDFTGIGDHPRLFVSDGEFKDFKDAVQLPRTPELKFMHDEQMAKAERLAADPKRLTYKKDLSGKRLLHVSREALSIIFSCSYAYRFTHEKKYLRKVESILTDVCSFPDWNPSHYLDVGEMSLAVAIGYDWLYYDLDRKVRRLAEEKLISYSLGTALSTRGRKMTNNWNQVCNAGVTAAAIAVWDKVPSLAGELISTSIVYNRRVAAGIYAPQGVYIEGPGYWEYGTSFQIVMNSLLKHSFGSDFGLEELPGFRETPLFQMNMRGNTAFYEYSDCGKMSLGRQPELWYFAALTGDWSIAGVEKRRIDAGARETGRLSPLYVFYAAQYDGSALPESSGKVYVGKGRCPVAAVRTGWGKEDLYLAVKGGSASSPHAHMDAGGFVYDALGVRWAAENIHPPYTVIEEGMKGVRGNLWSMKQDSKRWTLLSYNNFCHNTLSVNGKLHKVKGFAPILGIVTEDGFSGARFDLAAVLGEDVVKAERTAGIREGSYLEVRDEVVAADREVELRWTFVTQAEADLTRDGIVLEAAGKRMVLKAEGAEVNYRKWSSEPSGPCAAFDSAYKGTICGYTVTIPAGGRVLLTTTLK